tara:strand:- start:4163 stop:4678 length:516 start_codon:yes stop_codon:yes gene_type:complete
LKDDSHEYFQFNEKVFDYEIEFAPTPSEAASIVFDADSAFESRLLANSIALNISNLRILKKTQYFARALEKVVGDYPESVIKQVLHTLSLAVWSIYSSDPQRVEIRVIKKLEGRGFDSLFDQDDEAGNKKLKDEVTVVLSEYGFSFCDELDFAVMSLVEKGYFDSGEIKNC